MSEARARNPQPNKGLLITFEGNEGSGKSTQIPLLAQRLRELGFAVRALREPGGTPIGEEIRHTLKHSQDNAAMTPEAELLLMNASRAQLVREVIRPALAAGEIVLCDRFYDSTTAYQGYGRRLSLAMVRASIELAVGETRPSLTLLLEIPPSVSQRRLHKRRASAAPVRDRMEEADRDFFARVDKGYQAIAAAEPKRVRRIDATGTVDEIAARIWSIVDPVVRTMNRLGSDLK
jgi:dTMP kinase